MRFFAEGSRSVTVVGGRGVGKTALALRIARYLCARSKFCRILHLDLRPESEAISASCTDQLVVGL